MSDFDSAFINSCYFFLPMAVLKSDTIECNVILLQHSDMGLIQNCFLSHLFHSFGSLDINMMNYSKYALAKGGLMYLLEA